MFRIILIYRCSDVRLRGLLIDRMGHAYLLTRGFADHLEYWHYDGMIRPMLASLKQ
jgi:hypothetical protein